eukprot:Nk52_evm7s2367 gene=Nk52_evmTU7s2367
MNPGYSSGVDNCSGVFVRLMNTVHQGPARLGRHMALFSCRQGQPGALFLGGGEQGGIRKYHQGYSHVCGGMAGGSSVGSLLRKVLFGDSAGVVGTASRWTGAPYRPTWKVSSDGMLRNARNGSSSYHTSMAFRSCIQSRARSAAACGGWIGTGGLARPSLTGMRFMCRAAGTEGTRKGNSLSKGQGIRRLFGIAAPDKFVIWSAIGLLLVSSSVSMMIPFGMGKVIDTIFSGPDAGSNLKNITLALSGVCLVGGLANFGRVLLIQISGQRILARIRKNIYGSIIRQEPAFFDENKSGELVNRLSADVEVMSKALTDNISDGLRSLMQGACGIAMMLYMSPKLTGVVVALIPVTGVLAMFYGKTVKKLSSRVQDALAGSTAIASERIGNIRTVKAFAQEVAEKNRYNASIDKVYSIAKQEALAKASFFGTAGMTGNLIMLGVLYYGGNMMLAEEISIGQLSSFLMYTVYMGMSVVGLSSFYTQLMKGIGAAERVWEIEDRHPRIIHSGGRAIPEDLFKGELRFTGVDFHYPTRQDSTVFSNLNLTVSPGTSLAVVGSSGSGKSTLASLLLRLYEPQKGHVLIDGIPITDIDLLWLRSHIGFVSQEPALFSGSISDNISYGWEQGGIRKYHQGYSHVCGGMAGGSSVGSLLRKVLFGDSAGVVGTASRWTGAPYRPTWKVSSDGMLRNARNGSSSYHTSMAFRSCIQSRARSAAACGGWIGTGGLARPSLTGMRFMCRAAGTEGTRKGNSLSKGQGIRRLFGIAAPDKFVIWSAIGLLLVSSSVSMMIPFGMGKVIDTIFSGPDAGSNLKNITLALSGVCLVGGLANFGRVLLIQISGQRILARIRKNIYGSIIRQEPAFFDENKSGELVNRLSADVEVMSKALTDNISDGLRSLMQGACGIAMMLYMSPKLTGVVVALIPVTGVLAMFYGKTVKKLSSRVQDALAGSTAIASERIGNIRTVKAFAQEVAEKNRYNASIDKVYSIAKQEALAKASFFGTAGMTGNLIMLGVLYYGGNMMLAEEISIGQLSSFLMYTVYMGMSVVGLSSFYTQLMKGIGAAERVWEIEDRHPRIIHSGGRAIPEDLFKGELRFTGVDFHYPTRQDSTVFSNLNLTVSPGTSLAVVGSSGSGKSTLASLLLRLYEPQKGHVLIDGIPITDIDLLWLRSHIGFVSQEPALFSGSISDNISYGCTEATKEEIERAAKKANAEPFILEFPEGYGTMVGERGLSLSGGQRQRLAIARAILRDPRILILDEATSALDSESEYLVQDALNKLMVDRTVIVIAHRLSSIQTADRFGVMGEIIQAVEELDWHLPTEIQAEAVPLILGGGDVLLAAETGSGKTGAFCLPLIQVTYEMQRLKEQWRLKQKKDAAAAKARKNMEGDQKGYETIMNSEDSDEGINVKPAEMGKGLSFGVECWLGEAEEHHKGWQGVRACSGIRGGKYYYEVTVLGEGNIRLGWSTLAASIIVGTDTQSFGFGNSGFKSFAGKFVKYGRVFGVGDVVGCFVDIPGRKIEFCVNGQGCGVAYDIPTALNNSGFYPSACMKGKNARVLFNFGAGQSGGFRYSPGAGWGWLTNAREQDVDTIDMMDVDGESKGSCDAPLCLIMEPSHELAQQVHSQLSLFIKHMPEPKLRLGVLVGGEDGKRQTRMLKEGVDIVVGTPGKIESFVSSGKLNLSNIMFFVLDEADSLLSKTHGHRSLIYKIYDMLPKKGAANRRMQMIVCSATLHCPEVKEVAEKLMTFPVWVDLKGRDAVPECVHHAFVEVDPLDESMIKNLGQSNLSQLRPKVYVDGIHSLDNVDNILAQYGSGRVAKGSLTQEALSEIVKHVKPFLLKKVIDAHKMDQALIFVRTRMDADHLELFLKGIGGNNSMVDEYSCACLHGSKGPARAANLEKFKNGEVRFLICTDVAGRGIDINGLPFVINMTLPEGVEDYIHRSGRVGRRERMGLSISIVSKVPEKVWYHRCASRGASCTDARITSKGGCAIWLEEQSIFQGIYQRLQEDFTKLRGPEYQTPTASNQDGNVIYGEVKSKSKKNNEDAISHQVHILAPHARELCTLEHQAQSSFLRLKYQHGYWEEE